jgi:coenzyme F420-reducing hydrogenase alpha subunit
MPTTVARCSSCPSIAATIASLRAVAQCLGLGIPTLAVKIVEFLG